MPEPSLKDNMPDPQFPPVPTSIPGKLIPTFGLRWNGKVLEQRFTSTSGTKEFWVAVPHKE